MRRRLRLAFAGMCGTAWLFAPLLARTDFTGGALLGYLVGCYVFAFLVIKGVDH